MTNNSVVMDRKNLPVALTGHMGAGKTCLGEGLARCLLRPFIDLDAEIVRRFGKSIGEIFSEEGEEVFRERERSIISDILFDVDVTHPPIIALGGGTYVDVQTRDFLRTRVLSIYLDVPLETLKYRLRTERSTRPLLAGDKWKETLGTLYVQRQSAYAEADIIFSVVAGEKVESTLQRLVDIWQG